MRTANPSPLGHVRTGARRPKKCRTARGIQVHAYARIPPGANGPVTLSGPLPVWGREGLFYLLFIGLLLFLSQPCHPQNPSRWNVLFIAVDDMRVDLGCYGNPLVQTPNLDRLAQRSTLFQRAYCQQAVCNPSRASLLTGRRPDTIGVIDLPTHFRENNPDIVTLPQWFKMHGYFTRNIGKIFHNWRQDDYRGDPESWSVPAEMHYNSHGNDTPQTDTPLPPDLSGVPRTEIRDVPDEAYFDGRIASRAVEALEELRTSRDPFFLAVGFWKPHAPFNAPKRYWDRYPRQTILFPHNPAPPIGVPSIALHDSREILRGFRDRPGGVPTPEEVITLRHGYYAAISYVDAQIGRVLDALDANGLTSSTIVVFWSDHGYHLGEHGLWAKTSNFELDTHVPLMIAEAGQEQSQRIESLVELLDVFPTLTAMCGLPQPVGLEGKDLQPLIRTDVESPIHGAVYSQHTRPAYPPAGAGPEAMGYSMRTDRFRYTEWRDYRTGAILAQELYDHLRDPGESYNLAIDPTHASLLTYFSRRMASDLRLSAFD
ncbi:MAG: iduronate sulfatase [Planctomycetota bacterium]|nr:MAG: iduronate sulfatase [Planctomycetota bacterium]